MPCTGVTYIFLGEEISALIVRFSLLHLYREFISVLSTERQPCPKVAYMSNPYGGHGKEDVFFGVLAVIGGALTSLAITGAIPFRYAAPFEWMGVFCLMSGLAYLYSPWRTVPLSFAAFLFGVFADPLVMGGRSLQIWVYANTFVLAFALAGIGTSAVAIRFATIREA